jgi:hypothetical protein
MAITLQELQNLARTAENLLSQAVSKVDNALSILQSISDPCAPTAQATLDRGIEAYADAQQSFNVTFRQAYNTFADQWETAPEPIKSQANELLRSLNQGQNRAVARATLTKDTRNSLKKKVQDCNDLKQTNDTIAEPSINVPNNGELTETADDDQSDKSTSEKNQNPAASAEAGGPTNNNGQSDSTQKGENPSNTGGNTGKIGPGKRLFNPLTKYASYNYQLTLYMVTANAYTTWIASDRKEIGIFKKAAGGAYVIAQSGGINDNLSQRAPGFELDYYIDNLKIETLCSTNAAMGEAFAQDITFKIIEPFGFSFLSKLKQASDRLNSDMNISGNTPDYLKQFYILGIRFFGYDINGKLISGNEEFEGGIIDPNKNANSIGTFERYFDILLSEVKFKLDGRATVYNCRAKSVTTAAFDIKHGLIPNQTEVKAQTVQEALNEVVAKMNSEEKALLDKQIYTDINNYSIEFIDAEAKQNIATASLVLPSDTDKYKWSYNVDNTEQSTDAKITTPPDNSKRIFQIASNTSVVQCIRTFILQSSYAEYALKVIMDSDAKAVAESKNPNKQKTVQEDPGIFKWYNLSSKITNPKWDQKRRDWVYDIKYQISTYLAPVIESAYTSPRYKYPGPVKRYNYYFTGNNTEVISFDFSLDANYYISLTTESGTDSVSSSVPISRARDTTNQPSIGKLGQGAETQNSIASNLMDPKGLNEAKITIMGDPDFLMRDTANSTEELYRRFYEDDGYTINANSGQVFVELTFNQGVDYNNKSGLFDINGSIIFWKYPDDVRKQLKNDNTAIVVLRQMDSIFNDGKFTQVFNCMAPTFSDRSPPDNDRQESAQSSSTGSSTERGSGGNTTLEQQTSQNIIGLKSEPNIPLTTPVTNITEPNILTSAASQQTVQTPEKNQVADDDAGAAFGIEPSVFGDPGSSSQYNQRIDFDGTNYYDSNRNIIPPPNG